MSESYDLIVIGTGVAATTVATTCRNSDWRVAVIDRCPFGGTCALRGCDPKKVLLAAAEAIDGVVRMRGKAIITGDAGIDWRALQRFKRDFTDPVPASREKSFKEKGIDTYHGQARFTHSDRVQVNGATLQAPHIVIAAGAEPAKLPIEGTEHLARSDAFLELERLPRRLILLGGGFIGFEFAHMAIRAGAEVTILERDARPLRAFDPDLVERLVERTRSLGVNVLTGHEAKAIESRNGAYTVRVEGATGERRLDADLVVHGGGRVPAVSDLDLDAAGVEHDGATIALNEYLQSVSNPGVYAAGDAAAGAFPLTPVAGLEASAVAANLLEGNTATVDYTGIPSAVFSIPPLAKVGLLEAQARERNLDFRVEQRDASGWFTARRVNEPCYAFKTLVEEGTERILGAHIVGPDAAEVINLFALAMRAGLKAPDLKNAMLAYPTAASDLTSMFG